MCEKKQRISGVFNKNNHWRPRPATNVVCEMKKTVLIVLVILALAAPLWPSFQKEALAGFGITPPYVKNDGLTRSSRYDQKIILVRSDPLEDLRATVTVNVPNANDWVSIDKGLEFILPKGSNQVPMNVTVQVPSDAPFGSYKGSIRVVISSISGPAEGTVGISLGAQIDVDLNIIDRQIYDFTVRRVNVADLEVGHSLYWLYFPGKITFTMQIQNTGNVAAAPSRIVFDIYDSTRKTLLETVQNTNKIQRVNPFDIKDIIAELPTRLPAGSYNANYKIYKNEEIAQEGDIHLSVLPRGTIPGYQGYGLAGLYLRDRLILGIAPFVFLIGIGLGITKLVRRRRR